MVYSTAEFCIFFLAILIAYCLSSKYSNRFLVLLAGSAFFYAWAGSLDTLIFAFVILFSWFSVWLARRFPKFKRWFLATGIILMIFHLFFWKYAPWFWGGMQKLFPTMLGARRLDLPLPVGISFFTLQGIAYLVDFGRGEAEYISLGRFSLFKSFFPQLVAGPIVRVHQLLPQLERLPRPTFNDISSGLNLFSLGLMKKMLLADRIGTHVDAIFVSPSHFDSKTLLCGSILYTIQIWSDFSGYTDMGRGAARMLGIHLPQNFLSPYLARSPSEFWRRWHITLSEWIRDYIYIPLGGSRGSTLRVAAVATATMAISGLWHGANLTFLVWGLYHGALLVAERLVKKSPIIQFTSALPTWLIRTISVSGMFACTVFGWIIFRAPDMATFNEYIYGLVSNAGTTEYQISRFDLWVPVSVCLTLQIALYYDFLSREFYFGKYGNQISSWISARPVAIVRNALASGIFSGTFVAFLVVISLLLRREGSRAFIYFQF